MLQHLNVLLVVTGLKLNTVFEVKPYLCQVQGTITSITRIYVQAKKNCKDISITHVGAQRRNEEIYELGMA